VNAYDDEAVVRTTLLEGSVKVNRSVILKPGEQSVLVPRSPIAINHSPDIDQVMSWKNGQFYFSNTDIESIMRQMARWYDVQVEYNVHPADKYTVSLSRNVPVSKLLSYLELSGGVKFKVEGKKVIVM
jgi:ferric-dicitrate binding protein FerR (iron transport regulator)